MAYVGPNSNGMGAATNGAAANGAAANGVNNSQPQQHRSIGDVNNDTVLAGGLIAAHETNLAALNSEGASVFTGQDVVQELQKYGFKKQDAQAVNDFLDIDGSGQASAEEFEAVMNVFRERPVDADNNGEITGSEILNYIGDLSEEEIKAIDEEISAALPAAEEAQDEAVTEEAAAEEASQELDINQILESGDLSSLSQMGTDLKTGKYGVEGLTTASQIMREVFGMDYYSDEGQAVWNKLVEINQNYADTAITAQMDSEGSPIVLAYQNIYLAAPQPEVQEEPEEQSQEVAAMENMYNTNIEGTV